MINERTFERRHITVLDQLFVTARLFEFAGIGPAIRQQAQAERFEQREIVARLELSIGKDDAVAAKAALEAKRN